MTVSASIVLYNHTPNVVEPTISSLLNCSAISELVLVDNGGADWADQLLDPRISYIKAQRNGGYGYGHNLAISKAAPNTNFHLVCNPDISFPTGTLERLLVAAQCHQAGLYMPNVIYPEGHRQELCKLLPTPANLFLRRFIPIMAEKLDQRYLLRDADYNQPFFAPSLSGCFMLFRSEALLDIGGFDERYFMYLEDIDISRRVADKYGAMYIPDATVVHEFQKASYKNKKLFKVHLSSAIKYFNKWGWLFDTSRRQLNKRCLASLPRAK